MSLRQQLVKRESEFVFADATHQCAGWEDDRYHTYLNRIVLLAQMVGERLDTLIAEIKGRGAEEQDVLFYHRFRSNVRLLEQDILGDFIDLMRYQLRDSWEYGLDKSLDLNLQNLVYEASEIYLGENS